MLFEQVKAFVPESSDETLVTINILLLRVGLPQRRVKRTI